MVHQITGSIAFVFTWLGLAVFGMMVPGVVSTSLFAPAVAVASTSAEACGFNTADYGSGLVICDGDITSWANGNNNTYLYDDGTTNTVRTTHENGVVSEVSVSESGISAYIG